MRNIYHLRALLLFAGFATASQVMAQNVNSILNSTPEKISSVGNSRPSFTASKNVDAVGTKFQTQKVTADLPGCLEAPNGQYPTELFTPQCTGENEVISTLCWVGEYSLVKVTAGYSYTFSTSVDSSEFVTIGNEDGTEILASGTATATWTADEDRIVRFYLHSDANCNYVNGGGRPRVVKCNGLVVPPGEGCLSATGEWPLGIFIPNCLGKQRITAYGYTGEYSSVQVKAGTEYTFSSSVDSDFITLGDENGMSVLAYGKSPLVWTADKDQVVRFYLHLDKDCNQSDEIRDRYVSCGEPITFDFPPFDCYQGNGSMSALEPGYGVNPEKEFRVADDFSVAESGFTIKQITLDVYSTTDISEATFNIRSNNGGTPGDVEKTVTMSPSSSDMFATISENGLNAYRLVFDLETPIGLSEGTYWLEPTLTNADNSTVYWEMTTTGEIGTPVEVSNAYGDIWASDDSGMDFQAVFFVAGDCEYLGTTNVKTSNLSFYPNPVKDVLNISADQKITSVSLYNVAGQKVINNVKADNGKVNVSRLTSGTYIVTAILENGKTETFKVIKK